MLLVVAGIVYGLFAIGCFRLAAIHEYEMGVSVGEGMFTLLGAVALFAAVGWPRRRTLIVLFGTLPLVAWFAATPWNSGPPFLFASMIAPIFAVALILRATWGSTGA